MAQQRMKMMRMVIPVVLVIMLWAGTNAQSSSSSCTNVLVSLSPCLNYISGNTSTPSSGCCTQLANVVRSQPQCLCQVLNGGGSSLGININQTQAAALPGACNVQTPPISQCSNVASPAGSPAGSPESPGTIPSGSSSNTVPTSDTGSSDGTSLRLSFSPLLLLLFVASYTLGYANI